MLGTFEGYVAAMAGIGGIVAPLFIAWFGIAGALVVTGAILPIVILLTGRIILRADDIALVPERQLQLLRGVAMFEPLPITTIEELADSLEPVTFGAGETLMRAGEAGDRFILIETGSVVVRADGVEVRTIGPGGYCGEIAVLRGIPRTATVQAVTDVGAFGLRADDFVAALCGDREATLAADHVVGARLANRDERTG